MLDRRGVGRLPRLLELLLLLLDLLANVLALRLVRFHGLHQFQDLALELGIVGPGRIQLRQDGGVFLVALGGVQRGSELADLLVPDLELQLEAAGLHLGQLQLFFLGFESVLKASNLVLLDDDGSSAAGKLGLSGPQAIFNTLKLDQAIQYGSHVFSSWLGSANPRRYDPMSTVLNRLLSAGSGPSATKITHAPEIFFRRRTGVKNRPAGGMDGSPGICYNDRL